ncbi:MAG: glucokinase [Betaproteobacteria bacterium]|nr:glucokinase [Betaproteobacteria bacterium]
MNRAVSPGTGRLVLAGDVGGTKTLLQVGEVVEGGRGLVGVREQRFENAAYDSLAAIVSTFLAAGALPGRIAAACFAVAGPVSGTRVKLTNLPWEIDAPALAEGCGIPDVRLVNDFEAVGHGVDWLGPDDLVSLQAGRGEAHGHRVVLGAGTGLGVCFLISNQSAYQVVPTEAGHADFGPVGEPQVGLLRFLQAEFGTVSYERVLSGPGLVNIYRYLLSLVHEKPRAGADLLGQPDPAMAIAEGALNHSSVQAAWALDLFSEIYGAQAGNLALTLMARGGVYIAGGIAPKMLPKLQEGAFMRAFRNKGRFSALMHSFPVQVIRNERVGLIGAGRVAAQAMANRPSGT